MSGNSERPRKSTNPFEVIERTYEMIERLEQLQKKIDEYRPKVNRIFEVHKVVQEYKEWKRHICFC